MISSQTRIFRRCRGFSLVELMVGLTIGFIAVAIIMQSLSVFEAHKRTTTAGVDAQENGLLALMAIEADIRKAAVGFNHPALLSCQNYYSYYQAVSGTGTPSTVASFSTIPVVITDGAKADSVAIQSGMRIAGAAATQLATDMQALPTGSPDHVEIEVDRAYDLNGTPEDADDPPADLIVVANPDNGNCSLMRVTSKTGNVLTVKNVPASADEYNAPVSYMTTNNWPGFGGANYLRGSLVFRVGGVDVGGIRSVTYSVDANNQLAVAVGAAGAAVENSVIASEIVALQAQYGISNTADDKSVAQWVSPTAGSDWAPANLSASPANVQRIKAIRVAVVARSSQRDGALVSTPCADEDGNILHYGPCAWENGPAVVLGSASDTEWQHYRYRVYQTVIPMRNLLWPDL